MNIYTKHRQISVAISNALRSHFRNIEYLAKFTNFTKFYVPEDIKYLPSEIAHCRKKNTVQQTPKKINVVTYTFSNPDAKLSLKGIPQFEGAIL